LGALSNSKLVVHIGNEEWARFRVRQLCMTASAAINTLPVTGKD